MRLIITFKPTFLTAKQIKGDVLTVKINIYSKLYSKK